jgi:hypothetical protein
MKNFQLKYITYSSCMFDAPGKGKDNYMSLFILICLLLLFYILNLEEPEIKMVYEILYIFLIYYYKFSQKIINN